MRRRRPTRLHTVATAPVHLHPSREAALAFRQGHVGMLCVLLDCGHQLRLELHRDIGYLACWATNDLGTKMWCTTWQGHARRKRCAPGPCIEIAPCRSAPKLYVASTSPTTISISPYQNMKGSTSEHGQAVRSFARRRKHRRRRTHTLTSQNSHTQLPIRSSNAPVIQDGFLGRVGQGPGPGAHPR